MRERCPVRDNIGVRITVRTGDVAILVGAAAIAVYEVRVSDDEDLISRRISAYRRHPVGRVVADTAILVTALHLAEALPEDLDLFHHLMRLFRRNDTPTQ